LAKWVVRRVREQQVLHLGLPYCCPGHLLLDLDAHHSPIHRVIPESPQKNKFIVLGRNRVQHAREELLFFLRANEKVGIC
jgi:hypothetical protein